jgi:hypothetical protein
MPPAGTCWHLRPPQPAKFARNYIARTQQPSFGILQTILTVAAGDYVARSYH